MEKKNEMVVKSKATLLEKINQKGFKKILKINTVKWNKNTFIQSSGSDGI